MDYEVAAELLPDFIYYRILNETRTSIIVECFNHWVSLTGSSGGTNTKEDARKIRDNWKNSKYVSHDEDDDDIYWTQTDQNIILATNKIVLMIK